MAEMIVPGTYVTVRAEGLISAGRIAAGIVGVVGTAASGPVGKPVTLAGFSNAREIFGLPDDFDRPENGTHPLTLVRALEHIYNNGASTVIAVRVAGDSKLNASYTVFDADSNAVAVLTAKTPGTWGNDIRIEIEPSEDDCRIEDETRDGSTDLPYDSLSYTRIIPSPENRIRIFRGTSKRIETLDIIYRAIMENEEVAQNTDDQFVLANTPIVIEDVAEINSVQVLDSEGAVVREYATTQIAYYNSVDGDTPPTVAAGEISIDIPTGIITFEAAEVPQDTEQVIATYAYGPDVPASGQVLVTVWNGQLDYASGESPQSSTGDVLIASYVVSREDCVQLKLIHEALIESYIIPDGKLLETLVHESSSLVTAEADESTGGNLPATDVDAYFGTGTNTPGSNGAEAGENEYRTGLESIENKLVNIVVLAGQESSDMQSILLGHLNITEQTDYERIGVLGAPDGILADMLGHEVADDRIILVAPGIEYTDGRKLPPAYTAAAVAGLISSVAVQTSLTNKTLNIPGLGIEFNRGQQEQLIKRNVLALVIKNGFRVLKGITTSGEGTPFSAIPTRRIVDYAKYGVRSASNPYLGRLNNSRVRAALKATLDAFLTRMVEDEALTGYELEVTATRAQEIAGEVNVAMTLQPTFSIDFIKVTMTLK